MVGKGKVLTRGPRESSPGPEPGLAQRSLQSLRSGNKREKEKRKSYKGGDQIEPPAPAKSLAFVCIIPHNHFASKAEEAVRPVLCSQGREAGES